MLELLRAVVHRSRVFGAFEVEAFDIDAGAFHRERVANHIAPRERHYVLGLCYGDAGILLGEGMDGTPIAKWLNNVVTGIPEYGCPRCRSSR